MAWFPSRRLGTSHGEVERRIRWFFKNLEQLGVRSHVIFETGRSLQYLVADVARRARE
jgi:hypothetical protein